MNQLVRHYVLKRAHSSTYILYIPDFHSLHLTVSPSLRSLTNYSNEKDATLSKVYLKGKNNTYIKIKYYIKKKMWYFYMKVSKIIVYKVSSVLALPGKNMIMEVA